MTEAPPGREALVARAQALAPVLLARAAEAERLRRIPDRSIADIREAGLWRVLRPPRFGGWTTDFGAMIDISIALARGCASTSWVYINLVAHNWMLPYWPEAAEEEVWGANPEALIGSTLVFPAGRLAPAAGGFTLTGRWPYASGVDASDWMMLGAMLAGDGGPAPCLVVLPAAELHVIDTWHVAGLCAAGSKDVACADLFLPAHRVLDVRLCQEGFTPGTETLADAYKLPLLPLVPHLVAGPMIGTARGAVEALTEALGARVSTYDRATVGGHATVQLKLAEAATLVDLADLLVRENWREAQRMIAEGRCPPLLDRARWRRDAAYAAGACVRAVDLVHAIAGARANYLVSDQQRRHRDIHAAAHQIHLSWDINAVEFGRIAVGLPPANALL